MQHRGKKDSLLRCSVNKCFDGYLRIDDRSWMAKQNMDLVKVHFRNHQKHKASSKTLIFKTNEQKNMK